MNENKLKFGVCLYSFSEQYQSGELDLEGLIKKAKSIGYTGITLVAAQHCEQYPYPTDAWLQNLREILQKYEMEPICWEAYIDMGMRNDRDMTQEEIAEYTRNDLIYAYKAGFPMVKTQHSITPEVFESMLPLCKRLGVKLTIEMHHPHHPQVPVWRDEYLKIMARSEGWLGIVPDTGIFQRYPSPLHIREAYELGCRKEVMEKVLELKRAGKAGSDVDTSDMTDIEKEYTAMFFEKFDEPAKPYQLEALLPYSPMIHGKFYYLENDEKDECIPFEELVPILKKADYQGYIVAEYEGHHMAKVDDIQQLERFFSLLTKLYTQA